MLCEHGAQRVEERRVGGGELRRSGGAQAERRGCDVDLAGGARRARLLEVQRVAGQRRDEVGEHSAGRGRLLRARARVWVRVRELTLPLTPKHQAREAACAISACLRIVLGEVLYDGIGSASMRPMRSAAWYSSAEASQPGDQPSVSSTAACSSMH